MDYAGSGAGRPSISSIPDEVLGEIMFLSVTPLSQPTRALRHPALSTCRRWRTCALDTPKIWSYIVVTDKLPPKGCLSTWLTRSAAVPLHLHIIYQSSIAERVDSVFKSLEPHLQRLKTLRIHFLSTSALTDFLSIMHHIPHVQEIGISWQSTGRPPHSPLDLFNSLKGTDAYAPPHLRKFSILTNDIVPNTISLMELPTSQLTSLTINEAVSLSNMVAFLKQCSALKDLDWDMQHIEVAEVDDSDGEDSDSGTDADAGPRALQSLELPSLERLKIRGPPTADVLLHVQMPGLRLLHVSASPTPGIQLLPNVLKHVGLTHLQLVWFGSLPVERVEEMFTTLAQLEHLRFQWRASTLPAIKILGQRVQGSWHCPNLKRLFVDIGAQMIPGRERLSSTQAADAFSPVLRARESGLVIVVDQCEGTEGLRTIGPGVELRPMDEFPDV